MIPLQNLAGLVGEPLVYETFRTLGARAVQDDFKIVVSPQLVVSGIEPSGSTIEEVAGGTVILRGGNLTLGLYLPGGTSDFLRSDGAWAPAGGTGTVTSVDGSGGTTGLTLGGGPIVGSGTLTLGGTLTTGAGGTNKTSWTAGSIPYLGSTTAFAEDNSKLFYDGPNHRLGLNTTSPNELLDVRGKMRLGDDSQNNYPGDSPVLYFSTATTSVVANFTATSAGGNGAQLTLRADGLGTANKMVSGNWLGVFALRGKDDSGFASSSSARLIGVATETWSSTAHGAKLLLQVTPNGTTSAQDAVTIEQNKWVLVGASGTPSAPLQVAGLFHAQNSTQVFNVRYYGAKGDGAVIVDGEMTVGSAHLLSASNPFTSADVGKVVAVDGAGASGVTLVTTISTFNSAGDVTLAAANASGAHVTGRLVIWGTSDVAAFAAAAAAAAASPYGGVVVVDGGRFIIPSSLDLSSLGNLTIRGCGKAQSSGTISTQLIFTQASGVMISAQPIVSALHLEGLNIRIENTGFTGSVVKVTQSNFFMDECVVDGGGIYPVTYRALPGAFTAVDLTGAGTGNYYIHRVNFVNGGGTAIDGGQVSNVTIVDQCQFIGYTVAGVKDLGGGSSITRNTFEGLGPQGSSTVAAGGIKQSNAHGLTISGNWFGDNNDTSAGQAWIKVDGNGIKIVGNYISIGSGSNVTGVKMTAVSSGVEISGNEFAGAASGSVGIDGGGFAHSEFNVGPNKPGGATYLTGMTALGGAKGRRAGNAARNWQATLQTLTTGVVTTIALDNATPQYNRGGMWNSGANTRITVPVGGAGEHDIVGQITYVNGTGNRDCAIYKNGNRIAIQRAAAAGGAAASAVCCVTQDDAADGDYYEMRALQDSGGNLNTVPGADLTYLSVMKRY